MTTAMKEMIQTIIDIESKTYNQEQLYMLTALKVTALILLEKEKKQIIDANRSGVDMVVNKENFLTGKQYYNQTYQK